MMRIQITQTDIDKAVGCRSAGTVSKYTCPIAQSILRRYPDVTSVNVFGAIRWFVSENWATINKFRIDLTPAMTEFMCSFDQRYDVHPTSFPVGGIIKEH